MALSRERGPWSRSSHSGFAHDQLSVWLPLDGQQPRGVRSAPARSRESGGPSDNEFFGNLSLLCRSGFSGACHSTSQLTHLLGCAPVFLGTLRIFARCGRRICSGAFACFLEHRADGYWLLRHRAFPVTWSWKLRLINR